jgi:hypothetical protein
MTLENSSSSEEEEEESNGGRPPLQEVEFPTPSLRAVEAIVEQAPAAGVEAPTTGRSVERASASTAGARVSATVATTGAAAAPLEPLRKSKWGFSSLR